MYHYTKDETYNILDNEVLKSLMPLTFEPVHEISNNVVCATSKPQISLRIRAV